MYMKRSTNKKRAFKSRPAAYRELNGHKWATKMEIKRLLGGKRDLKLSADSE
jgi:hypothetical protein